MGASLAEQVAVMFQDAERAHHEASQGSDSHDPEWPLWYAGYLCERLPPVVGKRFTKSELVRMLMNLEEIRMAEAPDTEWAAFCAERLAGWADATPRQPVAGEPAVTGIGGIFFKARDPAALKAWYKRHLGLVPLEDGSVAFSWREMDDPERTGYTVWSPFRESTKYFEPSEKPFMINLRVRDLDGLRERLQAAGMSVDDLVEEYEYGRFGWFMDPEGNRIELWEPR